MCFDKRVSFLAWVVGTTIALALINRNKDNDQWMAFFIMIVVLIQLLEAVVWHAIETKNQKLNDTATRLILLTLVFQPVILMYGAFKWGNAGESLVAKVVFLMIIMNVVYNFLRAIKKESEFKSTVGPNGHLVWKTKDPEEQRDICFLGNPYPLPQLIYFIGLSLPFMYMKSKKRMVPLFLTGVTTLLYNAANFSQTEEFSSMWCFSAVGFAIIALLGKN